MEEAGSSRMLASFDQTIQHHAPERSNLHSEYLLFKSRCILYTSRGQSVGGKCVIYTGKYDNIFTYEILFTGDIT
jgi:hypothetical protein